MGLWLYYGGDLRGRKARFPKRNVGSMLQDVMISTLEKFWETMLAQVLEYFISISVTAKSESSFHKCLDRVRLCGLERDSGICQQTSWELRDVGLAW